jgi:pyrroline-5-carboxylate reductase
MTNHNHKIGFIGGGKMATAFISGLLSKAICPSQHIIVHSKTDASQRKLHHEFHVLAARNNADVIDASDTIVLAIKPQDLKHVLTEIADRITDQHLIVSLVTGASIAGIKETLRKDVPVVRVMSNTPARIGMAAQAVAWDPLCTNAQRQWVLRLCNTVGVTHEVPEDQCNAVMALAGSGPAFVFWMMEAFIKAGVHAGLPEALATQLTLQTFSGASLLAQKGPQSLADLIHDVSSPGGITLAGLTHLNSSDCDDAITETLAAAIHRAGELGKINNNKNA